MIEVVEGPALFPAEVRQHRVRFDADADAHPWVADVVAPRALDGAPRARRGEFLVGRACAREALRALGHARADAPIPIGEDRAPAWPDGVVGAIAHGGGLAVAVVASRARFAGVGVDCEPIVPPSAVAAIVEIALPRARERAVLARAGLDGRLACTIAFSSKESVYKALRSRAGRPIDFGDLELVDLDARGSCVVRPAEPLARACAGARQLLVRFAVRDGVAHTGTTLEEV